MAQKFLTGIEAYAGVDLLKTELKNAAIQNLATAPTSPATGQIYFNTTDGNFYIYDGSAWVDLTEQGDITEIIAGNGLTTPDGTTGAVTINVGAGNGISVATDSVSVLNPTNSGLVVDATGVYVGAGAGLSISGTTTSVLYDNTSIELDGSGNLSLKATGVTASTYGSNTAIPVVTVDADGRITNMSTASISTSFNLTDGTNTQTIAGGDTMTVNGTANETTTLVTDPDTLTIGLATDIAVQGQLSANNAGTQSFTTGSGGTTIGIPTALNGGTPYGTVIWGGIAISDSDYLLQVDSTNGVVIGTGTNNVGLVVNGNLTVSGTTTTKLSETVLIEDNIIILNSNETGTPTQDGGIEIERGTSPNAQLIWNESTDKWQIEVDPTANTYENIASENYVGTAIAATTFSSDITGDDSTTAFVITHSLSTRDVIVQVYDASTYSTVYTDVVRTSTAAVTVTFATAPATGENYRVVVNK